MARCDVCQNEYDKTFKIILSGTEHTFDCFECAIESLAPRCCQCSVRVIGHGFETSQGVFCSANCARLSGYHSATDRLDGFATLDSHIS
jgi:hypothetical protein